MLKKAINHVIQAKKKRIKSLMKLCKKRGLDCSQKATSIPLYLKSKVQNQREEDEGYEHYLVFLEKREESRRFDVFLCFLGEKYGEKKEKKMPRKMPKQLLKCLPLNLSCQKPFYKPQYNNFVLMHFFSFEFGRAFGGFPGLKLRRSWCSWKALDVQFSKN